MEPLAFAMLVLEGVEEGFDTMKFLLDVYIMLFTAFLLDTCVMLLPIILPDTYGMLLPTNLLVYLWELPSKLLV